MERPWWQRAVYQIWPKIYRFINEVVSLILRIIKAGVRAALKQIKRSY